MVFLEEVEAYKKNKDIEDRTTHAEKIIDSFLKDTSTMEVNINKTLKESVRCTQNYNNIFKVISKFDKEGASIGLFDSVVTELMSSVLSDSFARFKNTDEFKKNTDDPKKAAQLKKRMSLAAGFSFIIHNTQSESKDKLNPTAILGKDNDDTMMQEVQVVEQTPQVVKVDPFAEVIS